MERIYYLDHYKMRNGFCGLCGFFQIDPEKCREHIMPHEYSIYYLADQIIKRNDGVLTGHLITEQTYDNETNTSTFKDYEV